MPTPTDAFLGLSLSAAQNLNIVNGVPTLQQESLLATNRQDVYRWNLSSRSSLNLALSSLSGNANVGVGIDVNQNGLIDSADQFWQSSRDGVGNETIQLELLEAGTYYVVVNSVDSVATGYDLRIVAQTRQQTDILWRNLTNSTLGYWQFEGLQYIGSKQIPTPVGGEWTIEGIGDFNGDINDDILWRERSTGKMAVWLMANGTYTATPILNNVMVTADWQVKGVADIDLDGKADVVWHNPTSGDVYLWKMDGANRVSDKLLAQGLVGNAWALEKVADFNGDRTGDLLWRHQQTGELHLWGMTGFAIDGNKTHVVGQVNGQGQFTALQIPASTGWKIEGAGDFTGDGKADLLWRNSQGQIAVWAMDGWKVQSSPIWQGVVVDSGWQLVGIDDFSGDGKTDALWQHQSTGDLVIWQMNGTQTPMGSAMVNPSQNGQIKAIGTAVRPVVWDEAGDTWALATGLGTVTGSGRQVGTLSGWDRDDFYRFSLSAASPIGLWLHDLTGNGELQLLDSAGQVLASSTLGLGLDEVIQQSLTAGTYGIRVFHNEVNAQMAYQLDWTTTPSQVSIGSGMQLALASDTGISNSDGITNQSSVTVQGTGQTGSVVTVRDQAQQVLGQTRIGANGQWQLSLAELADGSYGLTAQVTNPWGYSTTGNALAITIDTASPILSLPTLLDGVAWSSNQTLNGRLSDADNQVALTYRLGQGANQTLTVDSQGNFNQSLTSLLAQQPKNQTLALTLQAKDRAGNEQALTYHFLNLDLQPIGDEGTWDGSLDSEYNNMSPTAPSNGGSGGSSGTGSGYLYLGLNGQWGTYGSGSSGGSGWSPVPMNGSDPATGYSLPPNLPETLPYLQALEVILKVATALISPQPETVAKKAMLHKARGLLVQDIGTYVETHSLYAAMGGVFNNIFVTAYGSNGSISKTEAVNQGIALAKALLADTRSVRLQTFQAQVLTTVLGAVNPSQYSAELRQMALALADTYSRFQPETEFVRSGGIYSRIDDVAADFLDNAWDTNRVKLLSRYTNQGTAYFSDLDDETLANSVGILQGLLTGISNPVRTFTIVNDLMNAAAAISSLWQGRGLGLQDGGFLREMVEFGFTLSKLSVGGLTLTTEDSSNWVNAILQGNAEAAVSGLAQLFTGTETADGVNLRNHVNFAERLLKVADAVDDSTLDQQVLKAEFLSHLVNLGGAYSQYEPKAVDNNPESFLEALSIFTNLEGVQVSANLLESLLVGHPSPTEAIWYGREILDAINQFRFLDSNLKQDAKYLGMAANAGKNYTLYHEITIASSFSDPKRLPIEYPSVPFARPDARAFPDWKALEAFLEKGRRIIANHDHNAELAFCFELFQAIQDCHNDLEMRYVQMLNDRRTGQSLYDFNKVSWDGHIQRYNHVREQMQRLFDFWDDHCGGDNHYWGFEESSAIENSRSVMGREPPDEPLPIHSSDFKIPNWAKTAGVVFVGGVIVVGTVASLPAWGIGALTLMAISLGVSLQVKP